MRLDRSQWILLAFNLLYLVLFLIYYVSIQDYEFLWYILVMVIVAGVIIKFALRKLDLFALWGLSIWGFLHMVGGGVKINGVSVYATKLIEIVSITDQFYILKMDQVIHFYGFFIAAVVLFQLLRSHLKSPASLKFGIFISWVGSMGLGALNEVVEFIALVSLTQTGVGDVYNMGLDLCFNLVGALAGSLVQYMRFKKK